MSLSDSGISALGRQVLAVTWSLTAASGFILALRVYSKFARGRGLWWDDYVLILSWLCFLVPSITITVEVQLGFGYHVFDINPENLFELGLLGQVTAFFSILSALWSKTSFAITMLRIATGWLRGAIWAVVVSMNVFMLLSAIFTWAQCTPVTRIWDKSVPGTCWNPQVVPVYNTFSGAYSGVMDISLAMLPWPIIMTLQMKKKEKFGVAIAMSMGVFAGVTAFVKCDKLQALASGDFTFDGAQLVIWGAAETATTIIASSIPVLRALFSEVKNSAGRYFVSSSKDAVQSRTQRSISNAVIITANNRSRSAEESNDTASDKSILATGGRIIKTAEVTVDYNSPRDAESGYEMERFGHPNPAGRQMWGGR